MSLPTAAIFDIDGTLAESKQPITADMAALLGRLLARMPVAVMSGGSWAQFQTQFLAKLDPQANLSNLYLFPASGAQCFRYTDGAWRPVYDNQFSEEEKTHIMQALSESIAETHFEQPEHLWGPQIEDRGAEITFSALGQDAPLEAKEVWDPTREKRTPLWQTLVQKLPDCHVALNATTSIDITRKGIDKAYGVSQLAAMLNTEPETMVYVGDALQEGGNDSVVIGTGVQTRAVKNPQDTAQFINSLLI